MFVIQILNEKELINFKTFRRHFKTVCVKMKLCVAKSLVSEYSETYYMNDKCPLQEITYLRSTISCCSTVTGDYWRYTQGMLQSLQLKLCSSAVRPRNMTGEVVSDHGALLWQSATDTSALSHVSLLAN